MTASEKVSPEEWAGRLICARYGIRGICDPGYCADVIRRRGVIEGARHLVRVYPMLADTDPEEVADLAAATMFLAEAEAGESGR